MRMYLFVVWEINAAYELNPNILSYAISFLMCDICARVCACEVSSHGNVKQKYINLHLAFPYMRFVVLGGHTHIQYCNMKVSNIFHKRQYSLKILRICYIRVIFHQTDAAAAVAAAVAAVDMNSLSSHFRTRFKIFTQIRIIVRCALVIFVVSFRFFLSFQSKTLSDFPSWCGDTSHSRSFNSFHALQLL